jgi:drug/metabolite transporter (DMT)-like permease
MRGKGYAAIAVAIICVSVAALLITWTASPSLVVAAYRMGLAALFVLPLALRSRDLRTLSRRDLALLAATGIVLAVHFASWMASLKEIAIPPASSLVLVTAHPLLVAGISHFVFRERIRRLTAVGIALGMCGGALVAFGSGTAAGTILGSGLALLGGVMAGLYLLAGRRLRQRLSLGTYAVVVYGVAAAALFAAVLAAGLPPFPGGDLPRELLLLLSLAGISQIGGHTLYNWALGYLPATTVSVSLLGEPIVGSLLIWAFTAAAPPVLVVLGAGIALPGIFVTGWSLEKGNRPRADVASPGRPGM